MHILIKKNLFTTFIIYRRREPLVSLQKRSHCDEACGHIFRTKETTPKMMLRCIIKVMTNCCGQHWVIRLLKVGLSSFSTSLL